MTHRASSTHVGELLLLCGVNLNVGRSAVLANNHASVDLVAGLDKHLATVLKGVERVSLPIGV